MRLAIIPQPKTIYYGDGTVSQNAAVTEQIDSNLLETLGEEAYRIQICENGVKLAGGSEQALCYARQTWEQIQFQCKEEGNEIPVVEIEDCPKYPYRSFHIDCVRHFFPMEELKKMIEMAAYFKFNRFHWHFSDDQGWRIESGAFPKLHEISSKRKGDHFGQFCAEEEYGGFYTREEVNDLVRYCGKLGIEIVPEIDMPGHVTAILASYPQFSCRKNPVEVADRAGIFREILCPGKEETFQFIEQLLDELLEIFPGEYFHIGGDEAPKERWSECPDCAKRMESEELDSLWKLQGYMQNRIADYLRKKGRKAIVWNEASYGKNLNPEITVQYWTEDKDDAVKYHLEQGGTLIVSNMMNSYCDYPYGLITLESVYALDTEPESLPKDRVIGTECLIWTEYIRDKQVLESLAWPRFAASAEAGWCGMEKPGYDSFCERLRTLFPVFAEKEIHATEESGWIPDEDIKMKQFAEFRKNFTPEILADFKKAQEDV